MTDYFSAWNRSKVISATALLLARWYRSANSVNDPEFREFCFSLRCGFEPPSIQELENTRREGSHEAQRKACSVVTQCDYFSLLIDSGTKQGTKVLIALARFVTEDFRVRMVPIEFLTPKEIKVDGKVLFNALTPALDRISGWQGRLLTSYSDCGVELSACRELRALLPNTSPFETLTCVCHAIDIVIEAGLSIDAMQPLIARRTGAMRVVIQKFAYHSGDCAWQLALQRTKQQSPALNMAGETRWNSWAKPFCCNAEGFPLPPKLFFFFF